MKDWDAVRICDLRLTLRKSRLSKLIARLQRELKSKGIRFKPVWYLSTEYGTVVRTCNIAILWSDAIDQIPALARKFRWVVRPAEVVSRVLRHEAGHAFNYVHHIYRQKDFRRIFRVKGNFFDTYPDDGWDPTRVDEEGFKKGEHINLRCMKHPDEDFAICFQTWLHPRVNWRRDYARQPVVLEKIAFVKRMAEKFGRKPYKNDPHDLDVPVNEVRMTVGDWFEERA